MLMVKPSTASTRMPARNEAGMATPTKPADRTPRAATTTIMTSNTALITLFCKSPSMVRISLDRSWLYVTITFGGQFSRSASTTSRTRAIVSMMFSPVRLDTSKAMAGWPLIRAKLSGSRNVGRRSAMSRMRTTESPLTLTGIFKMSSACARPRRPRGPGRSSR